MPVNISVDQAVEYAAGYLLARQNVKEERKVEILKAYKFNLLVKTFNVSSCLLAAAAVMAVFLSFQTSFVFLCLGLFLRFTTEKEIEKYMTPRFPDQPQQIMGQGEDQDVSTILQSIQVVMLQHALHQTKDEDKVAALFEYIGCEPPANQPYVHGYTFFEHAYWKNAVEIPEGEVPGSSSTTAPATPDEQRPPSRQSGLLQRATTMVGNLLSPKPAAARQLNLDNA